ncbi:MAG: hypothetical protein DWC10_05205 [Candidatus Poseidoniales archaeon]|nr:MAG: hypothetical protein DWC10_05205 [Candidatus Poseidoniales archaeon]
MATMFVDQDTGRVLVLLAFTVVSVALVAGSRHQPFPEISGRFGWLMLALTGTLALGERAPRPMSLTAMLICTLGLGSYGVLVGVYHMVRTRRDVFIAPMSGFIFCIGAGGLMVVTWPELSTLEQWAGFLLLVVLGGGQTWMVFRGLLIGRLPMAWSQAGMVALQRGQLHGPHGAIACFERGWDADEEHLNPMAYVALHRIHVFLGRVTEASRWMEAYEDAGGDEAVAPEWVDAIMTSLSAMTPGHTEGLEEG